MELTGEIALALDFSHESEIALRTCCLLAGTVGADHITILHAVRPVVRAGDQQVRAEELRKRLEEVAMHEMDEVVREVEIPIEIELNHRIVEGHPADAIPMAAVDMDATLLVVASHLRDGVRRWLKVSTAEELLGRARLPVLVLLTTDDGVPPTADLIGIRTMLVAVEAGADRALLQAGLDLAAKIRPEPDVVAVGPDADLIRGLAADCFHYELELGMKLMDPQEILQAVRTLDARLLVTGSHGAHTADLVRYSEVPVMVVPQR